MGKESLEWMKLYHTGRVRTAADIREMADSLLSSEDRMYVGRAIKIYRDTGEQAPQTRLLEIADKCKDDPDGPSIACYEELTRSIDGSDMTIVEAVLTGLDYLRGHVKGSKKLDLYIEQIEVCKEWVERKIDPTYDFRKQVGWIRRWKHGQLETKDELRKAAVDMIMRGDFDDALSIYLVQLDEEIPVDLLLMAAEDGIEKPYGFSIPRFGASIARVDISDAQAVDKIKQGLKHLKRKLRGEYQIGKNNIYQLRIDACEDYLAKRLANPDSAEQEDVDVLLRMKEAGLLVKKEEFRRLARGLLAQECFEDAVEIYSDYVGDVPISDMLDAAEESESDEFIASCYKEVIDRMDISSTENVKRVWNGIRDLKSNGQKNEKIDWLEEFFKNKIS